jgi:hypothetical protein
MYESVPMLLPIVCLWKKNVIISTIINYEGTDTLVLYVYYNPSTVFA